eukprot:CAMPEP_0180119318 /NCGR_PEP_ID=MMETSP0986-20121125/1925_1 /TAXON_ID=697907 /ORGANISM="non described non described, Strain CCMP2293" /LENGTH=109 /DNA_ID=CAMNT_0022058325 /DNA_START=265 /DNA_END=594 /DNA_ORIENTATION=-
MCVDADHRHLARLKCHAFGGNRFLEGCVQQRLALRSHLLREALEIEGEAPERLVERVAQNRRTHRGELGADLVATPRDQLHPNLVERQAACESQHLRGDAIFGREWFDG